MALHSYPNGYNIIRNCIEDSFGNLCTSRVVKIVKIQHKMSYKILILFDNS